jgi:hypothetical protein
MSDSPHDEAASLSDLRTGCRPFQRRKLILPGITDQAPRMARLAVFVPGDGRIDRGRCGWPLCRTGAPAKPSVQLGHMEQFPHPTDDTDRCAPTK